MQRFWTFKVPVTTDEVPASTRSKCKPRTPDPTPSEIRQFTAEIQSGWSDDERSKRETGDRRIEWSVPQVGVGVVQGR